MICYVQYPFEVGPLGTDAEVVQHDVSLGVLKLGVIRLSLLGLLDGCEVLATLVVLQLPQNNRLTILDMNGLV